MLREREAGERGEPHLMDELIERIARAIHEDDLTRFPDNFEWDESATNQTHYRANAAAVVAELGLEERQATYALDDTPAPFRRWVTPWERIEEGA